MWQPVQKDNSEFKAVEKATENYSILPNQLWQFTVEKKSIMSQIVYILKRHGIERKEIAKPTSFSKGF